jgi:CheY-like chemotaxis protein
MENKKVLIVEDTKSHRSFFTSFMLSKNYEVDAAEDGLKGLEMVQKSTYDMIFADVEMPNMNGLEFLKSVKELPAYKNIPVIMLTTVDKEEVKDRAKRLGALHYIVKPFNEEKINKAISLAGH